MEIPVLVEPVPGNGYRARGGEPLALSAEGATREEALQNLRSLVQGRLVAGAVLVPLEVPAADNPWLAIAGMFKDDPMFKEVVEIMVERRRQDDADPDCP